MHLAVSNTFGAIVKRTLKTSVSKLMQYTTGLQFIKWTKCRETDLLQLMGLIELLVEASKINIWCVSSLLVVLHFPRH